MNTSLKTQGVWTWNPNPADLDRIDKAISTALQIGAGHWTIPNPDDIEGAETPALNPFQAPPLSRSQIQRLINEGQIEVFRNAQKIVVNAKLKLNSGDQVILHFLEAKTPEASPINLNLNIRYEDAHIAIVDKPAGISVHPSDTESGPTLVHGLLYQLSTLSGVGGVLRPGIVHRLDKDTSGVMVVSKTDDAHRKLSEMFAEHDLDRRYTALCYGHVRFETKKTETLTVTSINESTARVESKIGRHPTDRKKMSVLSPSGRDAISHFKIQKFFGKDFTLIEAKLETGRTHQIRVHLSTLGYGLLGDPIYHCSKETSAMERAPQSLKKLLTTHSGQLLHAHRLAFKHPISQIYMQFEMPIPPYFADAISILEKGYPQVS
jgi:23S rRNA pseudouridine1911/1915/1917 synthase